MKKLMFLFSVFVLFGMISIGSIRFIEDNDFAQKSFILTANIHNKEEVTNAKNVRMKYVLLDYTDTIGTTSATNINSNDVSAKKIYTSLNDETIPGEYIARIYFYGDNGIRRIKHRPIIIG